MSRKNNFSNFAGGLCASLLGAIVLAGCGSPVVQQSARQEQAIKANHRGESAFRNAEYQRARMYFEEALRIGQSIENVGGMAANRINLARTSLALGDAAQTQRHLDQLLKTPAVTYPTVQLSEAAALQATLLLAGGNPDAALAQIEKGEAWCAGSCNAFPSLLLLRAQIALRAARPDEAIAHASNALRRLDGPQHPEEKANALRVIGEALLDKKDPAAATARFEQALALDREAGVPHKVSLDLIQLGQTSKQANRRDEANAYFRRAAAVRSAAGDKAGAELAMQLIEQQ